MCYSAVCDDNKNRYFILFSSHLLSKPAILTRLKFRIRKNGEIITKNDWNSHLCALTMERKKMSISNNMLVFTYMVLVYSCTY